MQRSFPVVCGRDRKWAVGFFRSPLKNTLVCQQPSHTHSRTHTLTHTISYVLRSFLLHTHTGMNVSTLRSLAAEQDQCTRGEMTNATPGRTVRRLLVTRKEAIVATPVMRSGKKTVGKRSNYPVELDRTYIAAVTHTHVRMCLLACAAEQ